MNLFDILDGLEKMLPILSGITGHPELGILAGKLLQMAEDEITRRQAQSGMTRAQILEDAANTFALAKAENDKLKRLGHDAG